VSTLLNVFHAHTPVIVYLLIISAWSLRSGCGAYTPLGQRRTTLHSGTPVH